jgi:serine/threonine protein kinase/Tfp pilus assembly protein PilF
MVEFNTQPDLNNDAALIEAARCQERASVITRPKRMPDRTLPPRIGPYRILAFLGEGGMGTVYLAEESNPVRRVALKVIKPGRDSKSVLARFEIEKQALALMDHSGIARVYTAGTTDLGEPYFSMEFVHGLKITDYCDRHRLPIPDRLRLFVAVCDAVQHAHHKGVIHRDIKPSNILVTCDSDSAVPKVIDFGVAKAMGRQLTNMTLVTQEGQLIGTPNYMSPEQAELTGREIDTRTDIYSLGVVLYELLTGAVPFDLETVPNGTVDELRRLIREVDPPKPSTRLTLLTVSDEHGSTTAARNRGSDVASLGKSLRCDLDWITMKALEKEQARRYSTAHEFAADVLRYLNSEPVLAGPPSVSYRLRKFTRRNRVLVSSAAAIFAVSVGAAVFSSIAAYKESAARKAADKEARKARLALGFLEDVFSAPMPEVAGHDVKVADYFDVAADRLGAGNLGEPEVEGRIRQAVGRTLLGLSEFDKAEPQLKLVLQIHKEIYGAEHPEVATALCDLARLSQQRRVYDDALRFGTQCLELREKVLGNSHAETAEALHILAQGNEASGDVQKAMEQFRGSIRGFRRSPQPDRMGLASVLRDFGATLVYRREYVEAEAMIREALDLHQQDLGESNAEVAADLNELGLLLVDTDKPLEAEPLLQRSLEIQRQLYGPQSFFVGKALTAIAELELSLRKYSDAERTVREAIAIFLSFYQEPEGCIANAKLLLAKIIDDSGRAADAVPVYLDAIGKYDQLSPQSAHAGGAKSHYGGCLTRLGRYQDAERELLAAYEILSAEKSGASPAAKARTAARLAKLYAAWGRHEDQSRWEAISTQDPGTVSQ